MPDLKKIMDLLRENYGIPESRGQGRAIDSLIRVILSQNTNDRNSDRAYKKLMEKFGSAENILEAKKEEVADSISVAGLHNIKTERIKKCLEKLKEERGNLSLEFLRDLKLEDAREWIMKLPGIGPKSAAVVLNFQFGKAAFPVDTHVFRVSKRLGLIPTDVTRKKAHHLMEKKVPEDRMFEFHLNLIRHGREVCVARTPQCSKCFLTETCNYYQKGEKPRK